MPKQVYCPRCGQKITLPRNTMSVGTRTKRQRQQITARVGAILFGLLLLACLAMAVTESFSIF